MPQFKAFRAQVDAGVLTVTLDDPPLNLIGFTFAEDLIALIFPDELYPAPRSWAERAYPKLIQFNKLPKGGHFAAWEQPKLFTEELHAGFRSLR